LAQREAYRTPQDAGTGGDVPPVPQRLAAIGSEQKLSDEDVEFLEFAFTHDLPLTVVQRNPKKTGSASRARYERYKAARSLREIKRLQQVANYLIQL
jgi:hypothetical protein